MAQGYETDIVVKELYQGWGSTAEQLPGLQMREPDSSDLDVGYQQSRRSAKVRGNRWIDSSLVTNDFANPTGGFTLQPRTIELLPLFMSHYQCVEAKKAESGGTVTGTFRFIPASRTPDGVGSQWGTFESPSTGFGEAGFGASWAVNVKDFYPLNVEQALGTIQGVSAQTQMKYRMGFVDQITWEQPFDGDLTIGFSFMFQGTQANAANFLSSGANFGTNYENQTLRFAAWNGTLTVDGTANTILDIESFGFTSQAKSEGKGRVGRYGFGGFRFGDDEAVGRISCEFQDYYLYQKVVSGSTFSVNMRWQTAADNYVALNLYNCRFRPTSPNLSSGDAPIQLDMEFEALATTVAGVGTPSHAVTVFTSYGSHLLSIHCGSGVSLSP